MKHQKHAILFILILLVACGTPQVAPTELPQQSQLAQPSPTSVPPTDTPSPTETPAPRFPADPQRVEFESGDGAKLVGYYYPASIEPAPILVLMHWVDGTNCEWLGVNLIQWAQNRALPEGAAGNSACADSENTFTMPLAEYPPLPAGQSFAVFAFDYRGHGESDNSGSWNPDGWLKDSIAAVQKARTLPGVDSQRVATIGASIGADGAIDGCGEGCLGALSFSPGNYLGVTYADAVNVLGVENKPAWCIVSTQDGESFPTCKAASGENYKNILYEQKAHGMAFFQLNFDPKTTQNIFDFLQAVFGK